MLPQKSANHLNHCFVLSISAQQLVTACRPSYICSPKPSKQQPYILQRVLRASIAKHSIMDPNLLLMAAMQSESTESVSFLNDMITHLWPYINVAASTMVKDIVEPMFADLLPGPFKSTVFRKIDLGKKPLSFDAIDVHTRSKDSIKLDVDVSWDGHCDIELHSPIIGKYGVKAIKLGGRLSIIMQPLIPIMPVVGAIQAGFINPPTVDLDFTGIANIADVSLLRGGIRKVINNVIASLFVLPNRFLVPINPANDYFATYILPIGYIRLNLECGAGFKTTGRLIKDVPDIYAKISLGGEPFEKSKTKSNSTEPVWNQYFDFVYADKEQLIHVHLWDSDLDGDDDLGGCIFPVSHLLEAPDQKADIPIKFDGETTDATVTISAQVMALSSLKSNFDMNMVMTNKNLKAGMMTVVVAGAYDIPDGPDLAPFCKVTLGEKKFQTPVVVKTPGIDPRTPAFNSCFRVPLNADVLNEKPKVTFELCNGSDVMGSGEVEFDEVLGAHEMKLRKDIDMENGSTLKTCVIVNSVSLQD